jgi:hypothetical protein
MSDHKKTMQRIMQRNLNALQFSSNDEYYNYCVVSYLNGQLKQCVKLFNQMPNDNKHELIEYIRENYANDEIHNYFVSLF